MTTFINWSSESGLEPGTFWNKLKVYKLKDSTKYNKNHYFPFFKELFIIPKKSSIVFQNSCFWVSLLHKNGDDLIILIFNECDVC